MISSDFIENWSNIYLLRRFVVCFWSLANLKGWKGWKFDYLKREMRTDEFMINFDDNLLQLWQSQNVLWLKRFATVNKLAKFMMIWCLIKCVEKFCISDKIQNIKIHFLQQAFRVCSWVMIGGLLISFVNCFLKQQLSLWKIFVYKLIVFLILSFSWWIRKSDLTFICIPYYCRFSINLNF